MLRNFELFGAIWSHLEAIGGIWSILTAFEAIYSYLEPFGAILEKFVAIQSHLSIERLNSKYNFFLHVQAVCCAVLSFLVEYHNVYHYQYM